MNLFWTIVFAIIVAMVIMWLISLILLFLFGSIFSGMVGNIFKNADWDNIKRDIGDAVAQASNSTRNAAGNVSSTFNPLPRRV